MNQVTVKEKLHSIHQSPIDYEVIFSGKKSMRVNGLYNPGTREIIIHNKNFMSGSGEQNDNLLMYTALHELAHHVMIMEKGKKNSKAHSHEFWATFHNLLDSAEEKGVYRADIDNNTKKLIENVCGITRKIAELQRELGQVILAIHKSCEENGLRADDVIEREAQVSKQSSAAAVAAYNLGDQGLNADIQMEAARQRSEDKREAIIAAGRDGKSVAQVKESGSPKKSSAGNEEKANLTKEKQRIEKTIKSLAHRLDEIKTLLGEPHR